ncbi:uncharacterized protein LOC123389844 [Mustela putorius furo]|uniref:Uncharacterized protein LOC123389844 n=1 Tax=Mustela putorius furo TaxID=9669 RepID=A0A8U0RT61_MUSPF|nr:uncharacterized protein LOC123389844 [Mustela putorius furo]
MGPPGPAPWPSRPRGHRLPARGLRSRRPQEGSPEVGPRPASASDRSRGPRAGFGDPEGVFREYGDILASAVSGCSYGRHSGIAPNMAPARLLEPPRPLALNCNGRCRWGFRGGGDGTQRRGLGGGTFLPSRKMDESRLPVPLFAGAARRPVIGPQSRKRRARPAPGILTVEGAPWSPGSAETLVACGAQRRAVDGLRLCLPTAGSGLGPLPLREPRRPSPDPGDGRGGDQSRGTSPEGAHLLPAQLSRLPFTWVSDEKGGALLSQSGTFLGNLSKLE